MHCPRCKKLQTTSSSTHYSCSCGHRWPLERASSTTTTTTTMTTTTTATATKAIILPSTERPIRTYPERIGDIIRRDQDFVFLPEKGRIGGASLSSGIFQEKGTGALWLGKCHHPLFKDHVRGILDEEKIEGEACAEKIPNDIYAYYGAEVPEMALSRQPMVNTGLEEDNLPNRQVVHVMCKLRTTAKTYDKLPQFRCATPNPNGYLLLPDGQRLVERGLGRILAVANFINDIDVIGIGGGNVMYDLVREPDQNRIYAQTLKIDPGYAFTREEDEDPPQIVPPKQIRVAHPRFPDKPNLIRFIDLPRHTQRDYLLTLHLIVRTNEATIRGFFTRRGGERFLVYSQRSVDSYVAQLCQRRDRLQQEYANELQATLELFQQTQPDPNPEQQEETHSLQSLYFYIPPQMKNPTSQTPELTWNWETLESHFLKKPYRVLLLQGESGSGKSLSLAWLKKHLLAQHRTLEEQRRALEESQTRLPDKKHAFEKLSIQLQQLWRILVIDLKRYHRDNVTNCLNEAIEEAHSGSIADWRRRFILLVLDGYDEIGGGNAGNLYNRLKLAEWPQLKVIITCRSAFLQPGYQSDFIPGREREKFLDYKLCPFTPKHIQDYLVRYVSQHEEGPPIEDYQRRFEETSGLKELIETPLLLRIACDALPQLRIEEEVTRTRLYEAFLRQWFANQTKRLQNNPALKALPNPLEAFLDFSRRLALHLAKANSVEITYDGAINSPWTAFFEDRHPEIRLARQGCPLIRSGNRYSFLHRSFLDYFTARGIWDALQLPPTEAAQVMAWGLDPSYILRDSAVIEFLQEMAGGGFSNVDHIVAWMVRTRKDRSDLAAHAAACAATLLNALQRGFSLYDLHGVRIPGANLRGAALSRTNLLGADLSGVCLAEADLSQTQLQKTNLTDIKLGQLPWIDIGSTSIESIAHHPNKPLLAIASGHQIILLNLETNQYQKKLEGHKGPIDALVFNRDGSLLASGSWDATVFLWNLNTDQIIYVLKGHTARVTSIDFSPDNFCLVSASWDRTVRLWDLRDGNVLASMNEHVEIVHSVSFSPNGRYVVSASFDKTVRICDISSIAKGQTTLKSNIIAINKVYFMLHVVFSPDGESLACACDDNIIYICNIKNTTSIPLVGHTRSISCIAFSPNGLILASGSFDTTVRFWDPITGQLKATLGHDVPIKSLSFSPDGSWLASSSSLSNIFGSREIINRIYFWSIAKEQIHTNYKNYLNPIRSLAFSPDGRWIASGDCSYHDDTKDNFVRLWDVKTGRIRTTFQEHSFSVKSVAFSPDGRWLASGGYDCRICLFDTIKKHIFAILQCDAPVESIVFSPDGGLLVSGGWSQTAFIWDIKSEQLQAKIPVYGRRVTSIAFSPSGLLLAIGSATAVDLQSLQSYGFSVYGTTHETEENVIYIWNIATGHRHNTLQGHTNDVLSVAFSPDGRQLISSSLDGSIRYWNIFDGEVINVLQEHKNAVVSVAFSNDSLWFASGSKDGTVRIWDHNAMKCIQTINLGVEVTAVVFSREGILAVGQQNGGIDYFVLQIEANEPRYVLKHSRVQRTHLTARDCDLKGAFGLKVRDQRLLGQLGSTGNPAEATISQRQIFKLGSLLGYFRTLNPIKRCSDCKRVHCGGFGCRAQKNRIRSPNTTFIQATLKKAQAGDVQSQYELGNLYTSGQGIERNEIQARYWYYQSAQGGYILAKNYVQRELQSFILDFHRNPNTDYRWEQLPLLVIEKIVDIMQTILPNHSISINFNEKNPFQKHWDNRMKQEAKRELIHYTCDPEGYLKTLKPVIPIPEIRANMPWILSWQHQSPKFQAFVSEQTQKLRHKANQQPVEVYWQSLPTSNKKSWVEKFKST